MATYIHKHGPENGNIQLEEYELGISDAAYIYSKIGTNITPLRVKEADYATTLGGGSSGPIDANDIFMKNGHNQVVTDPYVTFNDTVEVKTKVISPVFEGTATRAKYADLAENYESDEEYEPGTVVFVGSTTEVSANVPPNAPVVGIVSENPGYLLNSDPENFKIYVPVALKGRVKVKVSEDCRRGDYLIPDTENMGKARPMKDDYPFNPMRILGICINNSENGYAEIKV